MSIKANEVLDLLDQHINNDPLTGLAPIMFQLWTHFFPADTRLTVFRSEDHWAIFVEIICYRPGQAESSGETWVYSNSLSEPALLWYSLPYEFCPAAAGEYSNYPATPFQFCVVLDNQNLTFSPTPEEYAELGIVIAPDTKEQGNHVGAHILRLLCERLDHPFFTPEAEIKQLLNENWREGETPGASEMTLLWQTRKWRHPAIGGEDDEKRLREMPYFQALAQAIETGDVSALARQDPATFNTDWRIWDAEERAEEARVQARHAAQMQIWNAMSPEQREELGPVAGKSFFSLHTIVQTMDDPRESGECS